VDGGGPGSLVLVVESVISAPRESIYRSQRRVFKTWIDIGASLGVLEENAVPPNDLAISSE
jgi:hypothetical protein